VFFNVFDEKMMVAVIYWGWESLDFYRKWYGFSDKELIRQLPGPALNEISVQTRLAPGVLKMFKHILLPDKIYTNRIKSHYTQFRKELKKKK